ncbi:MAG: hypothetical protein ABRQ39_11625 [Candidatus Eremiobacterota bacterium]
MAQVEEKVERLEFLMAQSQLMYQGLVVEMKEFKNEMRQEMKDFKTYTQAAIEEMKQDSKKTRDDMNKKWGDLAAKWGTIVEDLVAPNVEAIGEKYFNLKDCDTFITNIKKRKPREKEFDVIAVYDTFIILVEVKSTPRTGYIEDYIEFIKNKEFYSFFPEYKDRNIIPVFASLHIPDEAIKHLSRNNILAMAMSDNIMDIVNQDIIKYLRK